MNVTDLLDAAKRAQGFSTDMALAKALGISRSAVSAWRNGVKTPDTVQCAALAGYTGLPLAQVLGIVGEARAISREEKAVWRKLAGSVALLLCAIGFSLPMAGNAHATRNAGLMASEDVQGNAYYVNTSKDGAQLSHGRLSGCRTSPSP